MNKKLISLLVAICLVIGLLPVASVATDTEVATAKLAIKQANAANTLEVTEGGEPIYGKSVEFDAYSSTGASKGKGYDYTTEGVSSADWNFKFEYPIGGQPTLTLNNFKLVLTDETGNPLYTDDGDGTYTSKGASTVGIASRNQAIDLKVVLQGENVIWTNNGIIQADTSANNKLNSLTIEGEDGGSLTGRGKAIGIRSRYGVPVTIKNAVMDLTVNSTTATAAPIYVANADITIENSTLSLNNLKDSGTVCAIHAEGDSSKINITNSELELTATGTAFNKAPTLSEGWTAVAGDAAASAVAVTTADSLATYKYVKVTYPEPEPTQTSAPTQTSTPTETSAPTQTSAPTETTAPTTATTTPTATTSPTSATKSASVKIMNTTELKVTEGGAAKYAKSVSGTAYNAAGEQIGLYWKSAGGTENDWNVKFEYPMGGVPTLTLKDVTFDYYDDEGNIMYTKADGTGVLNYAHSGIFPSSVMSDLKIILQGTNHIDVGYGIIRHGYNSNILGNVTIVGEAGSSLSGRTRSSGGFNLSSGYDLTLINANLDIWTTSVGSTCIPLATKNGNITIIGGKIKVSNTQNCAILVQESGNIIIENAEIEASNSFTGATNGSGTINASNGSITISNSTITATSANGVVLYGKNGVTINGGTYYLVGAGYAINGKPVKINGGVVEALGSSGAFTNVPDISKYVNCDVKAGASKAAATLRETITNAAYVYVGPHTHVWGEAEAVTADCAGEGATKRTCTVCEAVEAYVEVAGTGAHNVVTDAAVPATCYLPGLTEGSHCGDCGVVIVDQKTVLATGHTDLADPVLAVYSNRYTYSVYCNDCGDLVSHKTVRYQSTDHPVDKITDLETKNATCTEEGYQKFAVSCASCTENINTHTIILPKDYTVHTGTLTAHPAVAPDYNNDGNIAYWSCDGCGKYFADAAGTQQLEKDSWILYKLCNHTGGTATCYAKANCSLCGRPYGRFADHTPNADDGDCTTPILCSVPECGAVVTAGLVHAGGKATCIKLAECETCGKEYGNYASHTGGKATCKELAKCTVCGEGYGAYANHIPNPDDGNLETPVTCSICEDELGLPAPGGTIIGSPDIRFGFNNLKLSKYNEPKYLISTSFTTECVDGMEFTAWSATATGANEDNYNLKFYWNAGDPNPTIILRGYKWSVYNEESGKIQSQKDSVTGEYTGKAIQTQYPMILLNDLAYDVIVTADSYIGGSLGLHYTGDLSIKSEGEAKLTIDSMAGCLAIYSDTKNTGAGNSLTLDANLDLHSHGYYNSTMGSGVISTYGGDLIINGGNINCKTDEAAKTGIVAKTGGDIIINGGKVIANSVLGASGTTGAIYAEAGKVIINGGTVEPVPVSTQGIYGNKGVEINGGTVKFYAPIEGINAGADADIVVNGGVVEIIAKNAFKKKPILAEGIGGYAGTSIHSTNAYDPEKDYSAAYVKIGMNVTAPDPANGPTLPGADPNNPGENPAAPSIEPTASPTAAPGMKLPKAVTVELGGTSLRITKFDEPIYTVNTPVQYQEQSTQDPDGNVIEGAMFQGMKQTITTDENNWNAKFVWESDEGIPTLYINGMIIDDYNEETSKWRKYDNKPLDPAHTTAIKTPTGQYMRIVVTGEDSQVKTRFGINFRSKLRLESEGDAKIDLWCLCGTLYGATGMPLVVDANIDAIVHYYYNGPISHVMMTNNADLTINGGNINLDSLAEKNITGIYANGGGNVTINGGNITVRGTWGTSAGNGTIDSKEKIIINGGTVNVTAKSAVCMQADKGIEINGGILNLTSPWYCINAGVSKSSPANITFNGGTTTMVGQFSIYNQYAVPVIGEGMYAYAGAGPRSAEAFDGSDKKQMVKPWMLITDDESKKIDLDAEEDEEIDIPFDPTDAPTASTDPAATAPTADPNATGATDATEATEAINPEDEVPEDEIPEDDNYYNVTPNLNIVSGISDEIPDALIDLGIDSPDMIRDILVENVWAIDDYSDYFAFFTITLMYHDGEDWVEAGEEHFPADGYITAMLPYPEGTDIDTPFTAVHMFSKDAFGLTPGEVELLAPINTDEGILVELSGLSPVAIAWEGVAEENPPTGDTGIGMYVALMVVALLGMATTVVLDKKRKTR